MRPRDTPPASLFNHQSFPAAASAAAAGLFAVLVSGDDEKHDGDEHDGQCGEGLPVHGV